MGDRLSGRVGAALLVWQGIHPPKVGRPAAVLVALADGPQGAEVLLTRRSAHLRLHHGEISFPGGHVEPGETVAQAALRESFEEVALDPAAVIVHGELDHLTTRYGASIAPVVGSLAARPDLRPAADEVDRVLWVPLAELVRADTFHEEWWSVDDVERQVLFFELDDETVWGATARILHQLLRIVYP